ncbi:5'-3' exonuclease H3TH domain-containing protein [Blattabacterium sp. (Blaberus giganteus)]|uniref:5'-3' exonuclease n=1 Tax=Blattabacterium sp. (Blaberus giganteus) TaxID=1186051 RepID=UPI00025F6F3B|nr:5'-3' exonuclease H3TH domain-containing protein [Blattabacterium sp. (Blaberus giganteus)]AFJ90752.1 DNA polymerase I [Blattabacterium sp. (Blaberus giganteus)]
MNNNKKLFLIDAYPLIYQSYYAYIRNPLFTSKGINTSPIINFTYFLMNTLNNEKPSYMATIFDAGTSFRKKEYEKYKAHRKKTPEAIYMAIPYIIKILKTFKISFFYAPKGYEADDFIGTIAKIAENKGYIIYIITLDKDFFQLITENIKVYIPPFKGNAKKILGIEEIKEKFGVNHPKQVIDLWSMTGDPSDNIPGLPGVGIKNAMKFIKKYGSIEKLLNSTHDLNGKIQKNIEENKYLGLLSKKLITIVTNIPFFSFHEEKFYIKKPNWHSIKKIFGELEFIKLLKKAHEYYKFKTKE